MSDTQHPSKLLNRKEREMKIFKEKAGVISKEPIWVCICDGHLYTATTLVELIGILNTEWKLDKHLAG